MNKIVVIMLLLILIGIIIVLGIHYIRKDNNINKVEETLQANESNANIVENIDESQNTGFENINNKILIIYYSRTGNTETLAQAIQEGVSADMIKLETVKPYPSNYSEMLDYVQEEQRNKERPELKNKIDNIDSYDTIFLGYPIWWGDMATPIYSFLDEYDLSGKRIIPFVTSGSSGLSGTSNKIKTLEPNAEVLEALSITSSNINHINKLSKNWLVEIGF